jgi:sugar lactone lactonase YvrE
MTIEAGERQYEVVRGWGELPEGCVWGQVSSVAVDSHDRVHVFGRSEHPYMIFDPEGRLLDHRGEGLFKNAHAIHITPDDTVYFVDVGAHTVLKFDRDGRHSLTLGTPGTPSDTGFADEIQAPRGPRDYPRYLQNGVHYPGPPFNRPTDVSVSPSGEIYVSDGYRNCRVHKFAADGTLIMSWGQPGHARDLRDTRDGPGMFHTVHCVLEHDGRVYVADRDNSRIQIFTPDGGYLNMWTGFVRPSDLFIDADNIMYIAELDDRISILDLEGNVIGRFGSERSHAPGEFWGPHGLCVDSVGNIYIGETQKGARLQKFARTK